MTKRQAKKQTKAAPVAVQLQRVEYVPSPDFTEGTASFSMNLQCDQYDPRMKYQKIDFFQSQKVVAPAAEYEARFEAAYQFCKKLVLRRLRETAGEIYEMRTAPNPYPVVGQEPHPTSKANARAFDEWQAARNTGPRNHAKSLEAPGLNPEVVTK